MKENIMLQLQSILNQKKTETVDSKIKNFLILVIEKKRFNWCKPKNAKKNN